MIYCCSCQKDIQARLTSGKEIYPHRLDLYSLPFWKCDTCNNFVGCHHKTNNRTKPLGCIPSSEVKNARSHLHDLIDQKWKNCKRKRAARARIYKSISDYLGYEFHCAEVRSIDEARKVYRFVKDNL